MLRLSDPDQSPLLVTTTFDGGRAAFLSSAPGSEYDGQRWNRLDDPFVAFPLLHGLVQWLALPAQDAFHVEVELGEIGGGRQGQADVVYLTAGADQAQDQGILDRGRIGAEVVTDHDLARAQLVDIGPQTQAQGQV